MMTVNDSYPTVNPLLTKIINSRLTPFRPLIHDLSCLVSSSSVSVVTVNDNAELNSRAHMCVHSARPLTVVGKNTTRDTEKCES